MRRDAPPDPVRRSEEVAAVALSEQLDGAERRNADVDRLAALLREAVECLCRELDELGLAGLAACVAQEHRARDEMRAAGRRAG